MLKDKGASAGAIPYPGVIKDIEGNPRPRDGGWDIGPYEYQGTVVDPERGLRRRLRPGSCLRPRSTSPIVRAAGLPRGPGTSATATPPPLQNPSHAYTSYGSQDGFPDGLQLGGQQHQIEDRLHQREAAERGLLGLADLGDRAGGGDFHRRLHQLPDRVVLDLRRRQHFHRPESEPHLQQCGLLHGRRSRPPTPTATDTCTKSNYITACTEVYVYPDSYGSDSNTPFSSGSLSNLQAEDSGEMGLRGGRSPGLAYRTYVYMVQYVPTPATRRVRSTL